MKLSDASPKGGSIPMAADNAVCSRIRCRHAMGDTAQGTAQGRGFSRWAGFMTGAVGRR